MSINKTIAGLIFGTLSAIGAAQASDAQTESLNYLVGDWRCTPSNKGATSNNDDTAVVSTTRHNDWFVTYVTAFENGQAHKVVSKMTYNPYEKKFVIFKFCAEGGYGYGSSQGWEDDTLSFTGFKHSREAAGKFFKKVFKKIDDNSFAMIAQYSQDGKTYDTAVEAICTK